MLVRVVAPHFVAGIVVEADICVQAAPILKWTLWRNAEYLRKAFKQNGWRAHIVAPQTKKPSGPVKADGL